MEITVGSRCDLRDARDRKHGDVVVTRFEDNWVVGKLTPSEDFETARPLFVEFAEIADGQMLSFIDDITARIDAIGYRLCAPAADDCLRVFDVQIVDDNDIYFKLSA